MAEYIDREVEMNVCERPPITQAIKGGEKSICWSCFHWEVCFVKKNQPCIKCTRYTPAADVRPVVMCKGCKWTKTDGMEDTAIYCEKWDRWEMPPDGFCWLGKKRKETNNGN